MNDLTTLVVAILIAGYGLLSRRLERWWISMPMALVSLAYVCSPDVLGLIDVELRTEAVSVAEATLAFMLFRDAVRLDLRALRKGFGLPERLLAIGLPVMIVLGAAVAKGVFPGIGWVSAALVATMLAPTDAALGEQVVSDTRLPVRLRQGLNVESGLNDGLAVPVFLVVLDLAGAQAGWHTGSILTEFARQVGYGLVGGVVLGGGGGWLLRRAQHHGTTDRVWRLIVVLFTALACYVAAAWLGGSGFIGAFVGGIAFGLTSGERGPAGLALTGYVGTVFDALSFLLLGALLLPLALDRLTINMVVYATLSLVAVRMVSVFVAMIGAGTRWPTRFYMGWFGPRGLATVVFSLLVIEEGVPDGDLVAAAAIVCVVLSVYAHGLTARPFTGLYSSWYERTTSAAPRPLSESLPAHEHPVRSADRA